MTDIQDKLKALTDAFRQRIPEIRSDITQQWVRLTEEKDFSSLQALHISVHSLKGSSGTFGFKSISEAAYQFELSLSRLQDVSTDIARLQDQQIDSLSRKFAVLDDLLANSNSHLMAPLPDKLSELAPPVPRKSQQTLHYVRSDESTPEETLLGNLQALGLTIVIERLENLLTVIGDSAETSVVIVDLGNSTSLRTLVGPLKLLAKQCFRVVVLTPKADFATDLTLLRAGAFAILARPLSNEELTRTVMRALDQQPAIVCRILMVDDQSDVAAYFQALLQTAGMLVKVVLDPTRLYEQIDRFEPDILLLDINMPMASGTEVARVLRLHERYLALPILFLTGESSHERTDLIDIGSDDILSKAMDPAALVSQLRTRAIRARQIRAKMTFDTLSGLYNHGHIQHLAKQYFTQASPTKPMSLVMIDLDRFKQVNDTWGHDVGDQVITELGQLLRLRFRGADLVGRYGGEEFMVLMPSTAIDTAVKVVNEVRETFSRLIFNAEDTTFHVTFSAGICDSLKVKSLDAQFKKADEALYQAKKQGRNQVAKAQ